MAYDDRKEGLYTLRAKGQGGVNDKSSLLLLTYPCKVKVKKMMRLWYYQKNSEKIQLSECLKKRLIEASAKSSLIKASVVSWQLMASLRSIWLWYQLCLVEASTEK